MHFLSKILKKIKTNEKGKTKRKNTISVKKVLYVLKYRTVSQVAVIASILPWLRPIQFSIDNYDIRCRTRLVICGLPKTHIFNKVILPFTQDDNVLCFLNLWGSVETIYMNLILPYGFATYQTELKFFLEKPIHFKNMQ